jgi:hypothetical protein
MGQNNVVFLSITPPQEVQKLMDDRSALGLFDDMNKLMQLKAASAMEKAADNQGSADLSLEEGFQAVLKTETLKLTSFGLAYFGFRKTGSEFYSRHLYLCLTSTSDFSRRYFPPVAVNTAADCAEQIIKFVFQGRPIRRALIFQLINTQLSTGHCLLHLSDKRQDFFFLG